MEHLGRLAGEAGRRHAADFANMTDCDCEADQIAIDEYRLDESVLRRVQPAAIGIVVQDHVAFLQIVHVYFLHAGPNEQRHAADHCRAEIAGGDHLTVRQRKPAVQVKRLRENCGVGSAHERHAHLATNRNEDAADDV